MLSFYPAEDACIAGTNAAFLITVFTQEALIASAGALARARFSIRCRALCKAAGVK